MNILLAQLAAFKWITYHHNKHNNHFSFLFHQSSFLELLQTPKIYGACFHQDRCPSCCPTNNIKTLKKINFKKRESKHSVQNSIHTKTFLWWLHLMQQSIKFSGNAVRQFLTPVLRWTKDEHRTTGENSLQTKWNYVAIISGFSCHHRRPGGDGSQPACQRAVVNVGSNLHGLHQRNWTEVGVVEISVNPSSDHVEVW